MTYNGLIVFWMFMTAFVAIVGLCLLMAGDLISKKDRRTAAKLFLFCWAWPILFLAATAKQGRVAAELLFGSDKK